MFYIVTYVTYGSVVFSYLILVPTKFKSFVGDVVFDVSIVCTIVNELLQYVHGLVLCTGSVKNFKV